MDNKTVYEILSTVIFLIPIVSLIWKGAKQAGKLEDLQIRVEKLEESNRQDIEHIKEAINKLENSLIKIETSISYIELSLKNKE